MNFEQARSNMVLNQLRANRIRDLDLIEKIEDFPRENLFPKNLKHLAYSDQIIELDEGRFILPPLTSSHLVQCLDLTKEDKVLEIGSGIGTITSIINQYTNSIDCIESSEVMIDIFKKSLSENLFQANLLKTTIESFFSNKNPNVFIYSMYSYKVLKRCDIFVRTLYLCFRGLDPYNVATTQNLKERNY